MLVATQQKYFQIVHLILLEVPYREINIVLHRESRGHTTKVLDSQLETRIHTEACLIPSSIYRNQKKTM